ncbi:hypothetical protein WEH80_04195 [Actinomycetes bacterium KLBMP 9759]
MSRTTRTALLISALLALVVGGCSATVQGAPAPDRAPAPAEGPGSDPVAWTGRLCTAVLAFANPATKKPDFSASPDLPTVQKTMSAYLGSVSSGIKEGRTQLDAIGRSPVDGGGDVVDKVQNSMTLLEQDFTGAKAAIDGADPADGTRFSATLGQVEATVASIKAPDALGALTSVQRLQKAAERAPSCQQLSKLAAAVPR